MAGKETGFKGIFFFLIEYLKIKKVKISVTIKWNEIGFL